MFLKPVSRRRGGGGGRAPHKKKKGFLVNRMITLPPNVWGPFFWHTIHITAIGYPKDPSYGHKHAAKEFFESLQFLIPCQVCREHYKKNLQLLPVGPHLDRREDLFRWTVNLHNDVNKVLGKPILTENEVLRFYVRLGLRNRSPVITQDDFNEADTKAFIRGALSGGGIILVAAGLLWLNSASDARGK